jgi:gluconolactonase
MKKSIFPILFLVIFITFIFNNFVFSAEKASGLIAPGAVIKTVQSGFQGTEGPATDIDGNVYFSEMFGNRISKWSWVDGKVTVYKENAGMPNGLMFDRKGRLIVCEMANNRVTVDDMKGNITVLADSCNGKKLANPNDVWVDPKGGIYITVFSTGGGAPGGAAGAGMPGGAPGSGGPGGSTPGGAPAGGAGNGTPGGAPGGSAGGEISTTATGELGIFYISPYGKKVTRVANDITSGANGLIGTPDGKTIYIGDNSAKKMWSYKINADGTLTHKKLFCETTCDGMAMDEKNNVYITAEKAILIYSPTGELLERIAVPEGASNVEFCGKDRKTLFITYHGNIYTLEMAVKGAPTALDQAKGKK